MRRKRLFTLFLSLSLLLTGCASTNISAVEGATSPTQQAETTIRQDAEYFSDRDFDATYDEAAAAHIRLDGASATCDSDAVQITGSTVTILDEGTYILSGTLEDGMVIVNAEKTDKTQLVLDGVSIHSASDPPLYILQADKVFLTMAEGSTNTLSNGGTFTAIDENNIDAVIFSKEDLTMNGSGSLTITSPAGHGVVSKDELTVTGGTYEINAASHALAGKDCVCIANAECNITSGKDGIHAENSDDTSLGFVYMESGTFHINAQGDGISAAAYLQIQGGTFHITAGGGSVNAQQHTASNWSGFLGGKGEWPGQMSQTAEDDITSIKGIKAAGQLVINGGSFEIDAADDAIHSNSALTVNGGSFEIATGDDGFHADERLSVTGGSIRISKSYEGLEGLSVEILGGTISVYADDDGINAAGGMDQSGMGGFRGGDRFGGSSDSHIQLAGGTIYLNAGGDAVDSNGTFTMSGGDVIVSSPNFGDTSILDYGSAGTISGGTFIGTGLAGMSMGFSTDSTQGAIMLSTGTQAAGTVVSLTDAQGNVLLSRETDQDFSCVLVSHPEIVQGQTYTLTVGETATEITMDTLVYNTGGAGGGMMGGGMMGGGKVPGDRGTFQQPPQDGAPPRSDKMPPSTGSEDPQGTAA